MADQNGNTDQTQNPPPGITQDQLHQAIEKARMEERQKARQELDAAIAKAETANSKIAALESQVAELANLKTANQKLTDDLAALKASIKPDGTGVDVDKAIESAAIAAVNRVNAEWQQRFNTIEQELANERNTRQKLTLEQRKAQLIEQHGGAKALIPEMVHGNTEAEILASIESSKQTFQKVISTVGSVNTNQNANNQQGGLPNPPFGGAQGGSQVPANLPTGRLPLAEYAKRRQELKAQVTGRYKNNYITQ